MCGGAEMTPAQRACLVLAGISCGLIGAGITRDDSRYGIFGVVLLIIALTGAFA